MTEPLPYAAGRDADVYLLDGDRVLRRYRDGTDVTVEAGFMAHLHAAGFPVPRVHHAVGADLVLRRVPGPTMLAALVAGTIEVGPAAVILADLHRRLHSLAPQPLAAAAEEMLWCYLRELRDHVPPLVDQALAVRLANPTQTAAELARLPAAARLAAECAASGRQLRSTGGEGRAATPPRVATPPPPPPAASDPAPRHRPGGD